MMLPKLLSRLIIVAAMLIGGLAGYRAALAVQVPALGETTRLTLKQQQQLGRDWARSNYRSLNTLDDLILHDYTAGLVRRLKQGPGLAPYKINLLVLNNRDFNAFAIPGGVMGINLGLFLLAETEGEVASVVAHELAHLGQEHFLRRLEFSKANNPATIGSIFAGLALVLSGNVPLGAAAIAGTIGYQTENYLRLSRQFENEADSQAIVLLRQAKFDLQSMANMLTRLNSLNTQQGLVAYSSTHPLTFDRINNALLLIGEERYQGGAAVSAEYTFVKQRVLYLVGRGAEGGPYANALQLLRQKKFRQAQRILNKLQEDNPSSQLVLYTLLEALIGGGKTKQARQLIDERQRFSIANPMLSYFSALAYAAEDDYARAIKELQRIVDYYPEYPPLWLQLSDYYGKLDDSYNLFRTRSTYHLLVGDRERLRATLNSARRAAAGDKIKLVELESIDPLNNL